MENKKLIAKKATALVEKLINKNNILEMTDIERFLFYAPEQVLKLEHDKEQIIEKVSELMRLIINSKDKDSANTVAKNWLIANE